MKLSRILLGALIAALAATPAAAGIHVALQASETYLGYNTDFTVTLTLTQEDLPFNTYQAVLAYDAAKLSFIQEPRSVQEAPYVVAACGSRYHEFTTNEAQLSITQALLCGGVVLYGPGNLYVLHFRTKNVPGSTSVTFKSLDFTNGGYGVIVSSSAPVTVAVHSPTDTPENMTATRSLVAAPNPFVTSTTLQLAASPSAAQKVQIHDVRGHLVREFCVPAHTGDRPVIWDGRDAMGRPTAAGTYWVSLVPRAPHKVVRLTRIR